MKKMLEVFFSYKFYPTDIILYSFYSGLETIQIRAFIITFVQVYTIRKQESFLKKDFTLFYSARIYI